jgi:hypothetical protein
MLKTSPDLHTQRERERERERERVGLDDLEKRKFLTLPGLELRPLDRAACSQSLSQLPIDVVYSKCDGKFDSVLNYRQYYITYCGMGIWAEAFSVLALDRARDRFRVLPTLIKQSNQVSPTEPQSRSGFRCPLSGNEI